jgi:hypothetical protein
MLEKHYTINDLTELLSMSFERTRQLVKDEPGVLRFTRESAGKRRTRTMYRIPESVVERILRRSANPTTPACIGKGRYPAFPVPAARVLPHQG